MDGLPLLASERADGVGNKAVGARKGDCGGGGKEGEAYGERHLTSLTVRWDAFNALLLSVVTNHKV